MNLYYISPKTTFEQNKHCFHPLLGAHYMDLADGKILVSAHFLNHNGIEQWEFLPDVVSLPHPWLNGHAQLSDTIVSQVSSLGIISGHTVLDVADRVSKQHPLMKLRAF